MGSKSFFVWHGFHEAFFGDIDFSHAPVFNFVSHEQGRVETDVANNPILTSLGELQDRVYQIAKNKLTSLHSVIQYQNSAKGFDRSDISSQFNTVSDQEMAFKSGASYHIEEPESGTLQMSQSGMIQNVTESRTFPHLASEYSHLLDGMKKKGIPIDVHNFAFQMDSSKLRKQSIPDNAVLLKRKKKKMGKKKPKTTAELPASNISGSNKSCHDKCKDEYEAANRGSFNNLSKFLRCSPMYQQFQPTYLDLETPSGTKKKLPIKPQSIRELHHDMSLHESSSMRKTSKKSIKKKTPKTVTDIPMVAKGIKMNKSLAVLKQADSSRDGRRLSSGRESLVSKKMMRTNNSSKLLSGTKENLKEGLQILQPRYSLPKSLKPNSKRTIPTFSDVIYQQGLEKYSEREKIFEEARQKRIYDELADCTFKPQISELARKKSSPE